MPASECACFSLCHPEEVTARHSFYLATHYSLLTHYCSLQVQHFFFRLPIVTHEASPWYPYLLSVYHTVSVPLPFDLRTLGRRSKATQGLYSRPAQSGRSG
jgi:hypothetical protein